LLGIALLAAVLWAGHLAFRRGEAIQMRVLGVVSAVAALIQVLLGFLSVYTRLAVVPVSLHTLLAATVLTLLTTMATLTWAPGPGSADETAPVGGGGAEVAKAGRGG
jgi:heme A synthase